MNDPAESPGLDDPVVDVVSWSPQWAARFEAVRDELAAILPDATIEHVGSTSVPGLAAKPIVDVLVVVDDLGSVDEKRSAFERLGFVGRPWPDDPDHRLYVRDTAGRRTEHVHVFDARSLRPQSNRDFRDFLIAHPRAAERYAEAKRASARAHPDSRAAYGEGKRAAFESILAESAAWARKRRGDG